MTTQNNPHKFTLGQRVRCTVTGFVGVLTARVDHLNGCVQYCVKPPIPEDKPHERPDGYYIDEETLDLIDEGILDPPATQRAGAVAVGAEIHHGAATGGPDSREGELPR